MKTISPTHHVPITGPKSLILQFPEATATNHLAAGGSTENRARLMLEVTDAVLSVWDRDRVGMHLAPRAGSNDMGDSNPAATFGYVARELGRRGIAFLCVR